MFQGMSEVATPEQMFGINLTGQGSEPSNEGPGLSSEEVLEIKTSKGKEFYLVQVHSLCEFN